MTKQYIFIFVVIGLIPLLVRTFVVNFEIPLPWLLISSIGIAAAFYLGFNNKASYNRLWEARKIWRGTVNDNHTWERW